MTRQDSNWLKGSRGAGWKFLTTASMVAVTIAAAPTAMAQDTDENAEAIIVTGSRIQRTTSSAPVTQVGAEFIKDVGLSSVGDILQTQPSFGIGQGSQTVNHSSADAGSSFADLRSLGAQRTLVLFDSRRRVSGSAVSSAVDLSVVPPSLIESVDVVTGGASAIYGADAVSGVVNLRLKRNIRGFIAGVRAGLTHEGGGNEYEAYIGGGGSFNEDRGSVSVAVGYNKLGQLASTDRDFTRTPRRLLPNPQDTGLGDGQPAQIELVDFRFANFSRGGTICLPNANGTISRFYAIPGGIRPFQGQIVGTSGCSTYTLGGDGLSTAEQLNLRSGSESISMISNVSYELTDGIKAYLNFDYANTKSVVIGEEVADSQSQLIIRRDNPFIPAALAAELDSRGLTQFGVGRSHIDFGRRTQKRERNTFTIEGGFKGSIGETWNWEAFAQHGEFKAATRLENDRINANFFKAVDVVTNPANGQPMCRDTTATGCVPLNIFGIGVASPQALKYVLHTTLQDLVSKQDVVGGSLGGSLFRLPAGAIKVVAGAEYRKESLNIAVDGLSRQRALFSGLGTDNLNASFDVKEAYLEGVIPVLRNAPLARSLSIEGAVRVSDYNTIGNTTTWRVGGTWEVTDTLSFRVQRSTSVRAPSLFDLNAPETISRANVIDPCSGGLRTITPVRAANCTALGLAPTYSDPRSAESEFIYSGGNPGLRPEKSKSWTIGSVYKGELFGNRINLTVDYWNIDISGAIQSLNVERIINGCVDATTINNEFCPLVTRDRSNGGITEVRNYAVNLASLTAKGIDYQLSYNIGKMPSVLGSGNANASISLAGTYLIKREELGNPNDPKTLTILDGEIGYPKHRFNVQFKYNDGPVSVALTSRYVGSVKLDVQIPAEYYAPGVNEVKSRLYNDLAVFYDLNDQFRMQIGVRNLFNIVPPNTPQHLFNNAAYAGIGTGALYDNIGRTYMLGVSLKL